MYQNKKCREPLATIAKGSLHDTQGIQQILMADYLPPFAGRKYRIRQGWRLEHEERGWDRKLTPNWLLHRFPPATILKNDREA